MIVVARFRRAVAVSTCVFLAGSAFAQTSQKPSETVVVTGQKPVDDATLNAVVSQFIDVHAAKNRKTGQYMRDAAGPVCPITEGLPPAFNAFVTARVLKVAHDVGAPTDKSGTCKPNVEILFTDQPQVVVDALAKRTGGAILGMHFIHESSRLMLVTHPIQGWYVTGSRYAENAIEPVLAVSADGRTTKPGDDKSLGVDDAYHNAPERVFLGSKIPMRRVSTIVNALIIVDTSKLAGHEIGPVSDYVTMLALSQPASLDACNAFPSILDLMSDDCGAREKPQALTEGDIAYLKGLYTADLGAVNVSTQKENIAGGMKGNLDDPSKPAPRP